MTKLITNYLLCGDFFKYNEVCNANPTKINIDLFLQSPSTKYYFAQISKYIIYIIIITIVLF